MDHYATVASRQKPRTDLDFFFISFSVPHPPNLPASLPTHILNLSDVPVTSILVQQQQHPSLGHLQYSPWFLAPVYWEYRTTSNYVGAVDTDIGLHACVVSVFIHGVISPSQTPNIMYFNSHVDDG